MGNCQAAEVATVLIQHPGGGRTERAYWAMSAGAVMAANPGHYVAAVITSPPAAGASSGAAAAPVKHLKLLRPDDTLLLGRVYRLVSFEEVLREFASKRHVKLSRATIKAKEEVEGETRPAKPRRRRGSGGGVAPEEYSSRSLAKVMRQSDEQEPVANPSAALKPESDIDDHAGEAAEPDGDLEALLPPHGVVFGRRVGRQWRPALQSIAEG
ncbi:hypothetical protein E2562_027806 [Oryza meyeriana var. granulata]|uniref:Uncharacterized protein n=1 Tax=Oryza meyeriana var. granulata TaxID=110450 RepID=A0A6G1DP73_9ORYZ|nr:hypothetical protein E2562_027806 [Oryza meyeriana var. granulata]